LDGAAARRSAKAPRRGFMTGMLRLRARLALASVLGLGATAASCSDDPPCDGRCVLPTVVMMEYDAEGFFDRPFPSDARRDASERPILTGFPNPFAIELVDRVLEIVARDTDGFGVSSGIFFRIPGRLDPASLPTLAGSVDSTSSVQLLGIDPNAPDYLVRYPVSVTFSEDPGPFGAPYLLSVIPLQGVPLRPSTRYAVVVTRAVRNNRNEELGVAQAVTDLIGGTTPAGMTDEDAAAHRIFSITEAAGIPTDSIAGFTVFTTGDPVGTMGRAIAGAKASAVPSPVGEFARNEEFPTFCVYETTIDMPTYQAGVPPYSSDGGGFVLDAQGAPILQGQERAKFVVTVPKTAMPQGGYPLLVFSRTGGGGDRPLVDRGVRATNGGPAIAPGTGPALEIARVGFAGASVDGPHGGLRNVSGGDEQLLVFNFQNPLALRDNVRQSALELALMPSILDGVTIDVSDCPGAVAPNDEATFDAMVIMGHSMGASIAPLALVFEPRYRGIVLSGAGGSFHANMLYKEKPLPTKPLGELVLGLTAAGYPLTEGDPVLSMLQWAGEPADDPIYGRYVVREPIAGDPRHVLMMQGIVDHYIMPPIANATSLSFGLDLAGPALDGTSPELAELDPLATLLPLVGRGSIGLPAGNNAIALDGRAATAVVTQDPEDGIEDGHEVVFQTDAPKHAYACFLAGLAAGSPRVPSRGAPGDPCD
jgi:hypothetical protein